MRSIPLAAAAAILGAAAIVPAQHVPLRPITSSTTDKLDAVVSPNGHWVAYTVRRPPLREVWVVDVATGAETGLGGGISPVWSPASDALWVARGADLVRIAVPSGATTVLATMPEPIEELAGLDDRGDLVGFHRGMSGASSTVFTVPPGGGAHRVSFVENGWIGELELSPSGAAVLFNLMTNPSGAPQVEVIVRSPGRRTVVDTMGPFTGVYDLRWADGGNAVAYVFLSGPGSGTHYVMAAPSTGGAPPTTWSNLYGPETVLGSDPGARWLATGATWAQPDWLCGIGLLDARHGGGVIHLDPSVPLGLNGAPTFDGSGGILAVCAATRDASGNLLPTQVWVTEVGRELMSAPVPAPLGPFTAELPLRAGELGAIVASVGHLPSPVVLPGIDGGVHLDPRTMLVLATGIGNGSAPLAVSATLPPESFFVFHLQAVRSDRVSGNEITRPVRLSTPFPR